MSWVRHINKINSMFVLRLEKVQQTSIILYSPV